MERKKNTIQKFAKIFFAYVNKCCLHTKYERENETNEEEEEEKNTR